MPPRLVLLLLLGLYILEAIAAGVFRWADDQGRIHYGDRPPAGAAELVSVAPGRGPDAELDRRRVQERKLLDVLGEERVRREQEEARLEAERTKRQQWCAEAKSRLRHYREASYLYSEDSSGKRKIASFGEREAVTEALQKEVATRCP